ncbi:MAG: hypothetical protein K0U54_01150 [Bacteroidetes bacterium]|nr:hypothetical protein [Bacteroidota bacterium]
MKKLILYISFLLLTVLVFGFVLEFTFMRAHSSGVIRDKVSWVKSLPDNSMYDYAIFGSSRSLNTLQPVLIDSVLGTQGINLAAEASGPFEIKLMIQEFLKTASAKSIYVQVDYRNNEYPDPLGRVVWIPYIKEASIFNAFSVHGDEYVAYRYIPFYRFMKFGPKIGLRNQTLSLAGKSKGITELKGYIPIKEQLTSLTEQPLIKVNAANTYLDAIINICAENAIDVRFFTAPIYKSTFSFSEYTEFLPNYYDFSQTLQQKELFADRNHLNHQGSIEFTQLFISEVIKKTP